ncbi:MAG TPA: hypothetical protein VEA44_04055 [Caulobacter sp.]|nr:hypothetical protein [Caulobacter sp.]
MKRIAHLAACLAAWGLLAQPPLALAQAGPTPTPAEQAAAQAALLKKVEQARAGQAPLPRLSVPADAALLRAGFDYRTLQGREFDIEEGSLSICENALAISQTYYTIDVEISDSELADQSPEQARATDANAARYHDELALGFGYLIDCIGVLLGPAGRIWDGLDAATQAQARPGILQARNGAAQMFEGALGLLVQQNYTPANKADLLAAMSRNAGAYAAAMTPTQRLRIRSTIAAALEQVPKALRPELVKVQAVFGLTACEGLCTA